MTLYELPTMKGDGMHNCKGCRKLFAPHDMVDTEFLGRDDLPKFLCHTCVSAPFREFQASQEINTGIDWSEVRAIRNNLLASSDWTQMPDAPITNKEQWLKYRTALRTLTDDYESPAEVIWPERP